MPARTQRMLPFMAHDNWLASYAKIEGLERALGGMSRRARFESGMESAAQFLLKHYEEYRNEFRLFMPDMIKYVADRPDTQ
jgi:acyl carrier protein phosphodiesterase